MAQIWYASDLHLEFLSNKVSLVIDLFKASLDKSKDSTKRQILVLAGDIGYPKSYLRYFLTECKILFQDVLYVAGNHEYYGTTMHQGGYALKDICNTTGVIFLDNNVYEISDLSMVFIGTTLWSKLTSKSIISEVNDFS